MPVLIAKFCPLKYKKPNTGSLEILIPFEPTNFTVGETIELEYALIVFPPLTSNVVNPFEKRVVVFDKLSVYEPKPGPVFILTWFCDKSDVRAMLSTIIVFIAGETPSVEGIAQKVPPTPSDVKTFNAGINELFVLYALTCRTVIISVS